MPKLLHLCAQEGPLSLPYHSQNVEETRAADALSDTSLRSGLWDSMGGSCVKRGLLGPSGLEGLPTLGWDERRENVEHRLDSQSLEQLESKWSIVWSTKWATRTGTTKRVLYQCVCGYDTSVRKKGNLKKRTRDEAYGVAETGQAGASEDHAIRRAAYIYTGCLAHADVTYQIGEDSKMSVVTRVLAYLEHNDKCRTAELDKIPAIPLHEHVVEVALRQLGNGAGYAAATYMLAPTMSDNLSSSRINVIQSTNINMLTHLAYRGQSPANALATINHRYNILPSDFSRLYRQHYCKAFSIDIKIAAEHNVDNWLNPDSTHFKPDLHKSVFQYSARASEGERLKISISTPEMKDAAWAFCHKKQLVLDGMFGLCTSRLLVWIALGVDESGHGLPVAMFLFSAPSGNRATHAGYDTNILAELLSGWKSWLGERHGERFTPYAAITDTDFKERGALLRVWSDLILLLSKYLDYLLTTWMPRELWSSWSLHGRKKAADRLGIPVQDWLQRGGACKHMRAFRMLVEQWMEGGHILRGSFSFPASLSDAKEIEVKNRAWYGESYAKAVTSPPLEESFPRSQTSSIAAVQGNSHLLDCSESTGLPRHLESARFSHSDTDKDSLLPPPSHPRSTVLLEADADEASEILRTTGELLALDDEVQISDQPDTAGTEVESSPAPARSKIQARYGKNLTSAACITVMLEDPHFSLNMDGSYDEFHNVIQQIALKMRNPRDTMQPIPSLAATTTNSVASTGSSIPPLTARGVIYRDILPPSPEKRQKRHDSHGTF
ncbi:hypothetical protein BC835DRAFT_1311668 [Cytidiella melzeri]|nr:hypothetical protein BC835DRAFT_1311668 [Cytidiella melzeri]